MPAIRRQILIAASPRAVWRALTTADGLEDWLVDEARFDARSGGRVVLTTSEGGETVEERGMVHKWRPISHLEIAFDTVGNSEIKGSSLAFQVARDGGETRLSIVHSGGDAFDEEELFEKLDERWKLALDTLQALLDESGE